MATLNRTGAGLRVFGDGLDPEEAFPAAPREPGDLGVWRDITSRSDADIFCGLFPKDGNEGLALGSRRLHALARRGLTIRFDIEGNG